jgi:hypothetical protein
MNSESAQTKIRLMNLSLRCFVMGILSLLPLIGLVVVMIFLPILSEFFGSSSNDSFVSQLNLQLCWFLPAIALAVAIITAVQSGSVRKAQRGQWNAAKPYWLMGIIFAALGAFISSGLLLILLFTLLNPSTD